MAYCENCGTKGHDPRVLVVVKNKDDQFILAGPCCVVQQQAQTPPDIEYGLELSSHYGLIAYAKYGGLKMEYRRTPEQLKQWFGPNQQPQEQSTQHPVVEMPGQVMAQA